MSTTMNTTYKIAIGADHAGVDLKETVAELLKAWGHEVTDMGTMTKNSCDYSDYANAVASSIADGTNDRGILICRSGIGMSIAANRWVGVRAALCRTAPAAALSRQHNDSNLLCLASAYVDNESVEDVLDAWLHADLKAGAMNAASSNPPAAPCNGRIRNWRPSFRKKDAGKATTLN